MSMLSRTRIAFALCAVILLMSSSALLAATTDGTPSPEDCALLDDPQTRALMDGLLFKLLVACDRTDELGRVRQSPAEPIAPGGDAGPDVPVNDPGGDSGSSTTQSETSMALNEDTGTVCAGYNDSYHYFGGGGNGFTGFSRSIDGGATFVDQGALGVDSGGDPSIVWRRADGHFYFAALHTNGLGLWKSTDDCQSFQWVGNPHTGFSDDKELMAVDNNPASPYFGRLYMVFTNFSSDGRIWSLYSSDGGVTWTGLQAISATSSVQGAWPAVAPNGDVFVGWVKTSGTITIEIARSTDGGATFNAVTSPAAGKEIPRNAAASSACGRAALAGNIRYLPSPQVVVGPDGVLHAVYSYNPAGADECDVFYRRSTDSGATWGPEVRVHDDTTTTDQFFPTLSVGASNVVSATWYDRRLDPNNLLIDHYQAFSFDGGVTWQPSERLSDVSTPIYLDPNLATCYHGDYDSHIQTETHAVTQWADDRNMINGHNDPDVFSDPVPVSTDYLLTADPRSVDVCSPNDAVVDIDVLQFLGFTEPVTLAATGVPSGAVASFVPNPVTPPGSSQLTIGNTAAASPGSFEITVTGTSTPGGAVHDTSLRFNLYDAAPGGLDLVAPANGAVNQPQRPDFAWTAAAQAGGYRLQVATDDTFATVVLDVAGLTDVGYAPDVDLASNTTHYWRVRAANTCGDGQWSAVSTFDTAALPGDCATGTMPAVHYSEDFESGATGWTSSAASGPNTWTLTGGINGAHSGDFVYHVDDVGSISDQRLVSPPIALPASGSNLTVQFWTYQDLESNGPECWDAGILEVTTNGGASWTQLQDAVMLTDPYDGIISSGSSSPLATLPGWCGSPQPWLKSVVDMGAYAGQLVQLRFRLGTDIAVSRPGWDLDDVVVQTCVPDEPPMFSDGFESGDSSAWSATTP